jgi:hypothetical protein
MARRWGEGASKGIVWLYAAVVVPAGVALVLWGLSVVPLWITGLIVIGWVCMFGLLKS